MANRTDLPEPASGQIYEAPDGEVRHVTWVAPTPGGPRVRWRSGDPETGLRYGQASMAEWLDWVRDAKARISSPQPRVVERTARPRRVSCAFEAEHYEAIKKAAADDDLTPAVWVQRLVLRELSP